MTNQQQTDQTDLFYDDPDGSDPVGGEWPGSLEIDGTFHYGWMKRIENGFKFSEYDTLTGDRTRCIQLDSSGTIRED